MLTADQPWQIIALLGSLVLLRLAVGWAVREPNGRARVVEFVDAALIATLLVFCLIRPLVAQAYCIPSASMVPTLREGDRVLVLKAAYWFGLPQHGDIVVFRHPDEAVAGKVDLIKRVIGTGGDLLQLDDRGLRRNNRLIPEPYTAEHMSEVWPVGAYPLRVPQGHVLLLGDNRDESQDSRRWTKELTSEVVVDAPFVPCEDIRGRACAVFWPPTRCHVLRRPAPAAEP